MALLHGSCSEVLLRGSNFKHSSRPVCLHLQPSVSRRQASRCAHRHKAPSQCAASAAGAAAAPAVKPEAEVAGMTHFLDSLKWDKDGLLAVVVQHVDTGTCLMQAFADRAAINETMQTKLATFYSRSRKERWCKGETSGHFIQVLRVFTDCDRDSIIYLSQPIGPACHTGARTCWFSEVSLDAPEVLSTSNNSDSASSASSSSSSSNGSSGHDGHVHEAGEHVSSAHMPFTTLYALEQTIQERRVAAQKAAVEGAMPSWTARLLSDPTLLCKKVREEAGELCETLEKSEGQERAASEAADLFYHALVLLNVQGVPVEDVMAVLRKRFGQSGVLEKAARPPKQSQ